MVKCRCGGSDNLGHAEACDVNGSDRAMNLKQLWSIIRGRQTNFRWMNASWTYYPNGDPVALPNPRTAPPLTAAQKAYGLLWQEISDRPRIHEARRALLASMTRAEQRDAIAWVKANHPLTEREILEKSP